MLNVPAAHEAQVSALPLLDLPAVQAVQVVLPVAPAVSEWAAHAVHPVLPVPEPWLAKVLIGHAWHESPVPSEYVPAAQARQLKDELVPVEAVYVPARHAVHDELPTLEE